MPSETQSYTLTLRDGDGNEATVSFNTVAPLDSPALDLASVGQILKERARQHHKFPNQSLPPAPAPVRDYAFDAAQRKEYNDNAQHNGMLTWYDVLIEEVFEAFAETDRDKYFEELIQVAAVATRIIAATIGEDNALRN